MKTLSHLQNEAIKKFRENYENSHAEECNPKVQNGCVCDLAEMEEYWKQQIEKIVKESFKNTRVEEKGKHNANCEHDNNWCCTHAEELIDDEYTEYGYNSALSDKHNKECEFLGN